MRIVVKKVGMKAEVMEVEKLGLDEMQELVGGLIEPVYFDDEGIICWVNEEGKLNGLETNIAIMSRHFEKVVDTLNGDVFFTNMEEGKEGLTVFQEDYILRKLNKATCCFVDSNANMIPVLSV